MLRLPKGFAPAFQEIDKSPERRRHVLAAGIVEIGAGKVRHPILKDRHEFAAGNGGRQKFLEGGDNAKPGNRGTDLQFERIGGDAGSRRDPDRLVAPLELPRRYTAAGKTVADTGVVE